MRALAAGVLGSVVSAALMTGCGKPPVEPLTLEGNMLTIQNGSSREWIGVEVWLNTYYRVTAPSIPPGARFKVPLDTFVAGFGQRFDFRRMQVRDLRLTAKLPDGTRLELKKPFEVGGLAGVLGAFGGKR
jgi:hypothetical protein